MDLEVHKAIEHLAKISFSLNGAELLARSSFLAEIIREYVDKYDGMRLTMTYAARRESGLKNYKFSLHSTFIFNELFAIIESDNANEPSRVAFFARSIAINIWLPILSSRSQNLSFSPLTSERDTPLVQSIFTNNLNVNEAYVTCFETSLNSVNRTLWSLQLYGMKIEKAKAVIQTIDKLHFQRAVEDYVLANILDNTKHLLECQITPEQYQEQCVAMLYSDNSGLRTLGLLMMFLATATAAALASVLGVGIPLTISVATTSALLVLNGIWIISIQQIPTFIFGHQAAS